MLSWHFWAAEAPRFLLTPWAAAVPALGEARSASRGRFWGERQRGLVAGCRTHRAGAEQPWQGLKPQPRSPENAPCSSRVGLGRFPPKRSRAGTPPGPGTASPGLCRAWGTNTRATALVVCVLGSFLHVLSKTPKRRGGSLLSATRCKSRRSALGALPRLREATLCTHGAVLVLVQPRLDGNRLIKHKNSVSESAGDRGSFMWLTARGALR